MKGTACRWHVLLFFIILLSACNRRPDIPPPDTHDYPTIIWWTPGPEPVDFELGMENINRYIQDKIGVRLDMRMLPWQEMMERTQEIVSAGEEFDIVFVDMFNYSQYATLGALYDITDSLRSTTPELWEYIPDLVWSGVKIGGRIYAIPSYKDIALTQYWVFDKKLAEECGINVSAVHTWKDLDRALTQIKTVKGEDFYPLLLSYNEPFGGVFNGYDSFCSGLPIMAVKTDDPEMRVICILEDDVFIERLAMLRKWFLEGIINPDADRILNVTGSKPFFSNVGWPGAEVIWQQAEGVEAFEMQRVFGPVLSSETIQGAMNAISNNSTQKQEALQLLELVNLDPMLRDMFAYGVEGVHFEYVDDRVVRQLNSNWSLHIFSQGTFFTLSTTTESPPDQWERVKEQNDMAEASVLLGFTMDISELSTEQAACAAVWDKYHMAFRVGGLDLDTAINQCLEELRAAGLDILLSEAQKQINRFAASR